MLDIDNFGQKISETYQILTDPYFEKRLKAFDPNLKLMFDQKDKRWVILEKAPDNSGWNCIIRCEYKDEAKTPRPLGDWVFEKLHKYRQIWEVKMRQGANVWFDGLISEANYQKQKEKEKFSAEHELRIRDNLLQWRKASRELANLPTSDVTAGYRKVNYENV